MAPVKDVTMTSIADDYDPISQLDGHAGASRRASTVA
jgi:hypothetical protein